MALPRKPGTALPPESWAQNFDRGHFLDLKPGFLDSFNNFIKISTPYSIRKKLNISENKTFFCINFLNITTTITDILTLLAYDWNLKHSHKNSLFVYWYFLRGWYKKVFFFSKKVDFWNKWKWPFFIKFLKLFKSWVLNLKSGPVKVLGPRLWWQSRSWFSR